MEGGNFKDINNFQKWISSINMDNIQIVEYKTLLPIYKFVPELEPKLDICFQKYDDIVLEEIKNLIKNDYKREEKDYSEGTSEKMNEWEVGITQEKYKSYVILTKKYSHYFNLNNQKNEKKTYICGRVPDGFIICG